MAQVNTITGTDPAAGAEVSYTVGELARLIAIRFTLVTSATVATRTVTLVIDDGTNVVWRAIAPATQTASLTRQYLWLAGIASDAAFDGAGDIKLALPSNLPLNPAWRVRTLTTNIQAGDNFGAPLVHLVQADERDTIPFIA